MTETLTPPDDFIAPFQLDGEPVRGRVIRLGSVIDEILTRHDYPEAVANLLGEAATLAALVGASLKFEGRLIVQAQGDGPVSYVVADYDTSGGLRGYCQYDPERVAQASQGFIRPGAKTLLGQGLFIMTIDPTNMKDRYQGVTEIEGETLALCAETYFSRSEQAPARVRLATAQIGEEDGPHWRAGGAILQHIAADDARGETADAWERAEALFMTLGDDELVDPDLSSETLLFRLFHEDGVRLFPATQIRAFCRCDAERVATMLGSFPRAELADMREADGLIGVTCEYCSRHYSLRLEDIPSVGDEPEAQI